MKNSYRASQADFGKLVLRLNSQKEVIAKRLADGLTNSALAMELGISVSTMKRLLETLEIPNGHNKKPKSAPLFNNLIIVVAGSRSNSMWITRKSNPTSNLPLANL